MLTGRPSRVPGWPAVRHEKTFTRWRGVGTNVDRVRGNRLAESRPHGLRHGGNHGTCDIKRTVAGPRARSDRSRRAGFTLVELLVVIAIIGVLVALLLPAIQAAREAARRTDCKNRLKQMGVAIQNHASALRVFPTGGVGVYPDIANFVTGGRPNGPDKQGLNWCYQILPYLEQGAIQGLTTQVQLQAQTIPLYVCPSRRSVSEAKRRAANHRRPAGVLDRLCRRAAVHRRLSSPAARAAPASVRYNPRDAVPLTRDGYMKNQLSFWGGKNGEVAGVVAKDDQIYDGVIVRTPWDYATKTFKNTPRPIKFAQNHRRDKPYVLARGEVRPRRPVRRRQQIGRQGLDRRLGP